MAGKTSSPGHLTAWLGSLLVVVASLALSACGSTMIRGRVLDDNRQPVRGAAIATEPPTDLLITDHQGHFAITRTLDENSRTLPIQPGKYTLTIKKLGYEDKSITLSLDKRQEFSLGEVTLNRKQIEVDLHGDVEASSASGPVGSDLYIGPYRGE